MVLLVSPLMTNAISPDRVFSISCDTFDYSDTAVHTFICNADGVQVQENCVVISKNNLIDSNGNTSFYSQEKLLLVPEDPDDLMEIKSAVENNRNTGGGSNYQYLWDATYSVKGFMTVNYQSTTIGEDVYIGMTSITGGFEGDGHVVIGSGVSVVSHYLNVGQNGRSMTGSYINNQNVYNITFPVTQRTWSYTTPSSWVPVHKETALTTSGASYTINLKRGTGTWSLCVDIPLAINEV